MQNDQYYSQESFHRQVRIHQSSFRIYSRSDGATPPHLLMSKSSVALLEYILTMKPIRISTASLITLFVWGYDSPSREWGRVLYPEGGGIPQLVPQQAGTLYQSLDRGVR